MPNLVEIGPMLLKKMFLKLGNVFSHLIKLESPSPRDSLCQIWPCGSGEDF